ncbi:MAG: (2Fe-2S)-binding protein [Gammaproteobacteria bacterium]|nr:(2Fe-2S)-binding protein [Gammaproteobacteria bacterium]MDH3467670.1 (2Fe-2S)-binding protein [Gammaproteobacteria bacterium]
MLYTLNINGHSRSVEAEPATPLLWVIRDELNLTGTKFGCGVAACGACTVHFNGTPIRSCSFPVDGAADNEITTIEGLRGQVAEAVQQAWREKDVVQCGYCQSGQIMSAVGLLSSNPSPSDSDIDGAMAGNACRCATYVRIRDAIKLASKKLEV